ncbi:MAG: hypothetical protein ABI880_04480 [Acidobacteriota bacterium]
MHTFHVGSYPHRLRQLLAEVSLRARLADTAYATYTRSFTGRAMADRQVAAYRECLASRGLGPVH